MLLLSKHLIFCMQRTLSNKDSSGIELNFKFHTVSWATHWNYFTKDAGIPFALTTFFLVMVLLSMCCATDYCLKIW